ncbi:MAG: glutaminase, partial [Candidatus Marinamargulisbacteria bacterium]
MKLIDLRVNMSKQKRESGSVKVAEKNVVELDDVVPSVFKEDIFDVFKIDGHITKKGFLALLTTKGVLQGSPRISEAVANLALFQDEEPLDAEQLYTAIRPNISYIEKILKGNVIVPDFQALKASIAEIFEEVRSVKSGNVASYIPQLKRVNPEKYGISVCTADGQQFHLGDAEEMYCVQSTCKPVNYCLALEELGEGEVHNHVGREPSGASFNALTLNSKGLPHNPMINAGAIMSCSLIKPNLFLSDRFDFILDRWRALGGQSPVGFNNSVYLSEKRTADRNFALGYFMREKNAFPDNVNLQETLDFYFQCCSIELSASTHAVVAATLANSGVCPITGEKVLKESTVKDCLSLMYSCGMYDFSGEWAFSVGLPAKSGVSGALIIVIPNVMGISIWSPRLDELGNSVRGIEIAR